MMKHKSALLSPRMLTQEVDQWFWNRHLALFPPLRPEPEIRLRGYPNRVEREVDIRPKKMNHLLLSEASVNKG